MADRIEHDMVHRVSWLAGAMALALGLLRLGRLLRPAASGPPWQLILIAAALLGIVITWACLTYRLRLRAVLGANLLGMVFVMVRITSPDTALAGIFPTWETAQAAVKELAFGLELVRFGSAPVLPVAGLIAILALVMWAFGTVMALGIGFNRPLLGTLPPLAMYLQLATVDRQPSGFLYTAGFLLVVATALAGSTLDRREVGAGRARDRLGRVQARTTAGLPVMFVIGIVLAATVLSGSFATAVPESGVLDWRSRAGIGGAIYNGVSYNLFVSSVQTNLLSQSDNPVFVARVSELPPGLDIQQLRWKLATMEEFDGRNWFLGSLPIRERTNDEPWEAPDELYQGNVAIVDATVQIRSLRMNFLPTLYSPIALTSAPEIVADSFRVRSDGSIRFDARTFELLEYSIRSRVPNDSVTALATSEGTLSPIFERARQAGEFVPSVVNEPSTTDRPELEGMTDLPGIDPRIREAAAALTAEAETDFERALLLESFFRSNTFTYSVDIEGGHSATDIEAWLFDESSPNYRTGYCEQFATGMGVMARSLGMPTRVVLGFAPGDVDSSGFITVRERDAHAWVEVWIDGHGWTSFDPTPRSQGDNAATTEQLGFAAREFLPLPVQDEGSGVIPALPEDAFDDLLARINDRAEDDLVPILADDPAGISSELPTWLWWFPAALAGLLLLPVYKWFRRRARVRRLEDGDISAAWEEIVAQLLDRGFSVPVDETPREIAEGTVLDLRPLAHTYAKSVYAPAGTVSPQDQVTAKASFDATERRLRQDATTAQRWGVWWSLRSMTGLSQWRRRLRRAAGSRGSSRDPARTD